MSNRFTKYTADKLRLDGWLDKEQADRLRTQLKEAEWLLVNCPNSCDPEPAVFKEWWNRRDAFLNPKPHTKG